MLNERALESCRLLVLERTPEFHQCFSRTTGLVVISGKTHLDRKTVLHKNSQTTDAAKGNDFRLAVVAVTSRTSAKWQEYSKVPRVFGAPPWSFRSHRILWLSFLITPVHTNVRTISCVQKLVIRVLCASLAYKERVIRIHSNLAICITRISLRVCHYFHPMQRNFR